MCCFCVFVLDGVLNAQSVCVELEHECEEIGTVFHECPAFRIVFQPSRSRVRQVGAWWVGYDQVPRFFHEVAYIALVVVWAVVVGGEEVA